MRLVAAGLACALAVAGCGRQDDTPASAPAASTALQATASASTGSVAAADVRDEGGDPLALAHYDGYGDMRFGMDEPAFRGAWQGTLNGTSDSAGGCYQLTPKWVKHAGDFAFLFEHGRFARYDVRTAKETAPGGGQVGMSAAQIRTLYGARVQTLPHKYVAGASYLRVAAPRGDGVLLFETDAGGKVTRWRAGVPPQIDYVEGCA